MSVKPNESVRWCIVICSFYVNSIPIYHWVKACLHIITAIIRVFEFAQSRLKEFTMFVVIVATHWIKRHPIIVNAVFLIFGEQFPYRVTKAFSREQSIRERNVHKRSTVQVKHLAHHYHRCHNTPLPRLAGASAILLLRNFVVVHLAILSALCNYCNFIITKVRFVIYDSDKESLSVSLLV